MWGTKRKPEDPATDELPEENPAESPTQLQAFLLRVLKGAAKEFSDDNLSDSAAALTYYGVQALFPALLVLISILGFMGPETIASVEKNLGDVVPGSFNDTLTSILHSVGDKPSSASFAFILGLATALWSSSGYVAASCGPRTWSTTSPRAGRSGRPCPPGC